VEPEVIRHDVANNPVKQTQKEFMNKQELVKLRFQLITAVTDYDRKDSTKRNYNIYALPQYFQRVDLILSDVEAGADPRSAIVAGFIGTLRNFVLRKLKMSGSSTEEDRGGGSMYYKPVAKKNPVRQRKGWKIQTGSGNGWSDIKVSSGTDFYRNWHFKTKPDAQSELNELARIHGDPESYRIVPAATEQDFDLYNPVHRNNPVRQRIAVSLSRSQVRKNPLLESGATISRNSGINRRAASMT